VVYHRSGNRWKDDGFLDGAMYEHKEALDFNPEDFQVYNNPRITLKDNGFLKWKNVGLENGMIYGRQNEQNRLQVRDGER
jgi:hypothetical protein